MNLFELNNVKKDADCFSGKFNPYSPITKVYKALVDGKELSSLNIGKSADKAAKYIMELNSRAAQNQNDIIAVSELNTLRRFILETPVKEEMKLLSVFGSYKPLGFDETVERVIYKHVGQGARKQANNGDVLYTKRVKETYQVPTFTVSGGYEVDYRRAALGDMTLENEGMEQVKIDIKNNAFREVLLRTYKQYTAAEGVKYSLDAAGLTKTAVDKILGQVRRFGRPTIHGDYALLSQFVNFIGYVGKIDSTTITGISEKLLNEIAETGLLGMYNGSILSEMPNPYDVTTLNEAGDDFVTMLPPGLGIITPAGKDSPIATWTKGGLTSLTGNDPHTGKIITRFDLECAADLARGQEHKLSFIHDQNLDNLDELV